MNNSLLERTFPALGEELILKIQRDKFCVVGCGGTGALFAEMLVRTGAQNIALIDGDKVAASNLNRVVSFVGKDIDRPKVVALKSRLERINPNIQVITVNCHLRQQDPNDVEGQKARDIAYDSDVVIIAVDQNESRIRCEKLCRERDSKVRLKYLGIGVYVDENGSAGYECYWGRETPKGRKRDEGYGVGSYAAIVIEATSVAFSMLLHNLKNPSSSEFCYFPKSYKNFMPEEVPSL